MIIGGRKPDSLGQFTRSANVASHLNNKLSDLDEWKVQFSLSALSEPRKGETRPGRSESIFDNVNNFITRMRAIFHSLTLSAALVYSASEKARRRPELENPTISMRKCSAERRV